MDASEFTESANLRGSKELFSSGIDLKELGCFVDEGCQDISKDAYRSMSSLIYRISQMKAPLMVMANGVTGIFLL